MSVQMPKSQSVSLEPAAAAARTIIATALAQGIKNFVLCPGSRCAPLAIALAQAEAAGKINLRVEIDERVAAFIALGMGKAGKPAAVVVTSGSAVANLHPAVEEAFFAAVPLLVISADRPHELRGVRASQTTDQTQVLRGSLRALLDLPASIAQNCRALENQVRRAVRQARGIGIAGAGGAGPVQLNIAFREPLHTAQIWDCAELVDVTREIEPPAAWRAAQFTPQREIVGSQKRTVIVAGPAALGVSAEFSSQLGGALRGSEKIARDTGVLLGSAQNSAAQQANVEWLRELQSEIGQIPILAEPSSILRQLPQAMCAHPELLRSALGQQIQRVILIGHPTLTREVTALLARPEVEVIAVDDAPSYTDLSGIAREIIDFSQIGAYATVDLHWYRAWEKASFAARRAIAAHLADFISNAGEKSALAENALAKSAARKTAGDVGVLGVALPAEAGNRVAQAQKVHLTQSEIAIALAESTVTTFYAASSIIREVNLYGSCARQAVYANRGLAGIDGNISTALGIALATGEPVRVAVGDLAFLHDLGALVQTLGQKPQPDFQIVILDDGGGSLFATLEYGAGDPAIFERVFRVGKEFDFAQYAKALGEQVKFQQFTGDYAQLQRSLARPPAGIELLYFDLRGAAMQQLRQQRAALREKIRVAVAESIAAVEFARREQVRQ